MIKEFIPTTYQRLLNDGEYTHQAPSNIALVKYWGKQEGQLPANPSVSFTLSNCYTETSVKVSAKRKNTERYDFDFYFEGALKESFRPKLVTFFERIEEYLPFITQHHFEIRSRNSFPHSSGIASSASSMAALSVCFMKMEKELLPEMTDDFFWKKASFLARLGSGSACRSLKGSLVVWGEHSEIEGSSNLYGVEYPYKLHSVFENYQDTILLIDKGQKQVSSSQGHNLMYGHWYAKQRFVQASENISKLKTIFAQGDLETFIQVVESEALTLHAMMMTSVPYFILMKPNTLAVIEKIWQYRRETNVPIGFTLDAGANIHILYPHKVKDQVLAFIQSELAIYCENGQYICDEVK